MRKRADIVLVERGFFSSRARAQAAIAAGLVSVGGVALRKASDEVAGDARIEAEAPHPWASRGGVKLAAALDAFALGPSGLVCLDVGASTGGFTDVLLARGAAKVIAVDVGRGQLDPRPCVGLARRSLEGVDARALTPEMLGERDAARRAIDVSFIGRGSRCRRRSLAADGAWLVAWSSRNSRSARPISLKATSGMKRRSSVPAPPFALQSRRRAGPCSA